MNSAANPARPLDPERTRLVQRKVAPAVQAFVDSHRQFTRRSCPKDLYELVRRLATATTDRDLYGKLWIVQMARIPEYQPDN